MKNKSSIIKKEALLIFGSLLLMLSIAIISLLLTKQKLDIKAIIIVSLFMLIFMIAIRTFRYYLEKKNLVKRVPNKKTDKNYEKIAVYGGIGLVIASGISLIINRNNPNMIFYFILGIVSIILGTILLKRKNL